VKTRKMPPWFADARYGKFSNATALTESEIRTIVAWVEAGQVDQSRLGYVPGGPRQI